MFLSKNYKEKKSIYFIFIDISFYDLLFFII